MTPAIGCALAFLVAAALSRQLAAGQLFVVMDHPNERSLHETPTPRTGGLAIVAGLAVAGLAMLAAGSPPAVPAGLAGAAVLVVAISLADDVWSLSASVRMLVHVAAALCLVADGLAVGGLALPGGLLHLPPAAAATVTVLGVVWLTNLYNFMDGMDGLAGGMGVIGFAALALLAARAGGDALALGCALVAAASAGFLLFNFPPARLFMGDSGSSLLGLLAASFALIAEREGLFPIWIAALVFSPFLVDATVTLLRRAARFEAVWRAHRSHFYQRLVGAGWSHRRTTLAEYALMLGCAGTALLVQDRDEGWQQAALWGWGVGYVILALAVTLLERRHRTG